MTHLTRDELVGWRDAPNPAERDRIVLHVAGCDECGAVYAELMRTRPAVAGPEALEPAAFMAAGAGAGPVLHRAVSWRRVAIPLAAAAVLIVGVTTLLRREPASYRGGDQALRLSVPSGTVDRGTLTFEWIAQPGTPSQRLVIYSLDDPSQPVIDAKNVNSPLRLTREQLARLRPGIDYRWMVEFATRDGRVETSAARGFRLR
jgi:hypothetical protein